jgi:GNAT superfamily N-acetyltransferase
MIKPLKQTDYIITKKLFQNVFNISEDPYFIKAWATRNKLKTVGYWDDEELVAAAIVTSRLKGINCLEYIFTNPLRKGEGIGTTLLQYVIEQCSNLHLLAAEDERVHAWYIKNGFHATSANIFTRYPYNLRSSVQQ